MYCKVNIRETVAISITAKTVVICIFSRNCQTLNILNLASKNRYFKRYDAQISVKIKYNFENSTEKFNSDKKIATCKKYMAYDACRVVHFTHND